MHNLAPNYNLQGDLCFAVQLQVFTLSALVCHKHRICDVTDSRYRLSSRQIAIRNIRGDTEKEREENKKKEGKMLQSSPLCLTPIQSVLTV